MVDEVAGADAGDSGGVVVDPLGATRWAGFSVGAAADGVVVVLGVGVGDVVGWAAAMPPPVASIATASDATIRGFMGESRCEHGKCRYFVVLAI
ncbi:hypothetical protein ACFVKB_40105 [Rhodococcus sp. NPDC127530]|uniref:hypothetical protein n=1 Tax=unclassified Rhodococcus (in: high G+C Gram-positive bacteria) TaxID=192944 RepID=UPI00362AA593